MEFNSQICTTKEQSERLLALGLKAETADMKHFFDDRNDYPFFHRWKCFPYKWDEESLVDSENTPAWSLHRLMEIGNFVNVGFLNIDKMYECCIQMIEGQIRGGILNKKYLNEK